MSIENIGVERWLFGTLAPLGIPVWSDTAPDDATYPLVVFVRLDGADLNALANPGARVKCSFDYAVRVYAESRSFDTIEGYAGELDTLLQGAKGPDSDGKVTVLSSVRQEPLLDRETLDGVTYAFAGGVYRIDAQEGV